MSPISHWRWQRRSAVLLAPLTLWLLYSLAQLPSFSVASINAWLASPLQLILLWLMVSLGFLHSRLGVQVILEDYVANVATRRLYNGVLVVAVVAAYVLFCFAVAMRLFF